MEEGVDKREEVEKKRQGQKKGTRKIGGEVEVYKKV